MTTASLNASSLAAADASESLLIARAQRGDETAFAEIFERHKRRVYSLCLRMTRVPADAEDLTQKVFLLLFRKISTFRGESAFSTWLPRMVANVKMNRTQATRDAQLTVEAIENTPGIEAATVMCCAPNPSLLPRGHLPPCCV